jgi:hypothetical protein
MKTLVYFIKPKGRKGPIKIGCSEVPADRLSTLSAWSPWPLEIIGTIPGGYKDERYLHDCFAEAHVHREWFKATPLVVQFITKIIAAGSISAVMGQIAPVRSIRSVTRRKRTDGEKKRYSYASRVRHCESRTRKVSQAWHAPYDVESIISRWRGYKYWCSESKQYVVVPPTEPSPAEIARLDAYLADPITHSVIPRWAQRKEPILVPHLEAGA